MDELMAAMVLSSLSCSPLLHSPATAGTGSGCGELAEDKRDHWGTGCYGNGSPTPSPPLQKVPSSLATPPDEGMDMDLDQVPLDEPAVRKRRVSERRGWFLANETPPLQPRLTALFLHRAQGKRRSGVCGQAVGSCSPPWSESNATSAPIT